MRNNFGVVQLELFREGDDTPAVLGTDCVLFIDGRWSEARATEYVNGRGEAEAEARGLQYRGSVYLLRRGCSRLVRYGY